MSTFNISNLNLTDTFYDWYLTTNQIIDFIDDIKVYDVLVQNGLTASRDGSPGVITIELLTDPQIHAIDVKSGTGDEISYVMLNIADLSVKSNIQNTDIYVVSPDVSQSQVYKISASNMLPPIINGDHNFNGAITVGSLNVSDGIIQLGSTTGYPGIYASDSDSDASWYYDTFINAWTSGSNISLKDGQNIITDYLTTGGTVAKFPFYTGDSSSLTSVDIQLKTTIGSEDRNWSIKSTWGIPYELDFSHWTDLTLDYSPLTLRVYPDPTNGVESVVKVNDTIEIVDILNSKPFSQIPVVNKVNVPLTDSTNGFLSRFVNRIKVSADAAIVGRFVFIFPTSGATLTTDSGIEVWTKTIGIVESISGGLATVITSGEFIKPTGVANFTPGAIYYLNGSAGQFSTSPGVFSKPVFIATSTTTGLLFPDLASGSGGLNSAFTSASIVGGQGTVTASGATALNFKEGTGINLQLNSNNEFVIEATNGLPTGATYSVYNRNASTATHTPMSGFSVLTRPDNGNLSSVVLNPGTILGRRDDTDDSDNQIQGITFSQLRSFMGFSGNSYINTINFRSGANTLIKSFDASVSEIANIKAGSNITFELLGNELVINAVDINSNGPSSQATNSIVVSAHTTTLQSTTTLDFDDNNFTDPSTPSYIKFRSSAASSTSGIFRMYAVPGSDFMSFSAGTGTVNFRDGLIGKTTLKINGDSTGISTSVTPEASTSNPTYTIKLSDTIKVNKIQSAGTTESTDDLILSARTNGDNTLKLIDNSRPSGKNSVININAYDTNVTAENNKTIVETHCVSMYADGNTSGGITDTYPFRFEKIIVNELDVENLTVNFSSKTNSKLDHILGVTAPSITGGNGPTNLNAQTLAYLTFYNEDSGDEPADGFVLQFLDGAQGSNSGGTTNAAFIMHPDLALNSIFPTTTYNKSIVISDKLAFANFTNSSYTLSPTPTIGWKENLSGGILVKSPNTSSFFRFENSSADFGTVGIQSGYSYLTYSTVALQLKTDTIFDGINTITLKRNSSSAYKVLIPTSVGATDLGKVAVVTAVNSGVADVEFKTMIKSVSAISVSDPIGTLYYST